MARVDVTAASGLEAAGAEQAVPGRKLGKKWGAVKEEFLTSARGLVEDDPRFADSHHVITSGVPDKSDLYDPALPEAQTRKGDTKRSSQSEAQPGINLDLPPADDKEAKQQKTLETLPMLGGPALFKRKGDDQTADVGPVSLDIGSALNQKLHQMQNALNSSARSAPSVEVPPPSARSANAKPSSAGIAGIGQAALTSEEGMSSVLHHHSLLTPLVPPVPPSRMLTTSPAAEIPDFTAAELADMKKIVDQSGKCESAQEQSTSLVSGLALAKITNGPESGAKSARGSLSEPTPLEKRSTFSNVKDLVKQIRNTLEKKHGSMASMWVQVETQLAEGEVLTIGTLQKGMVSAGVAPQDAKLLLQSMLENRDGPKNVSFFPDDPAPNRADFFSAILAGKLPQTAMDAANRRLNEGTTWWSDGNVDANFSLARIQDTTLDAHTILTQRRGVF